MKKRIVASLALTPFIYAACSSSSGGTTTASSWQDAFSGVAISSPLSGSFGTAQMKLPTRSLNSSFELDGSESMNEKIDVLEEIASGEAAAGCRVTLSNMNGFGGSATCYGPTLNYSTHQDGGGNGSLPGGDVGMWEETEASGEACAAAQVNQLVRSASTYFDSAMMLQASAVCVLTEAGTALPSSGSSVDFAPSFETIILVSMATLRQIMSMAFRLHLQKYPMTLQWSTTLELGTMAPQRMIPSSQTVISKLLGGLEI